MKLINSLTRNIQQLSGTLKDFQDTCEILGMGLSETETRLQDTIKTLKRQKEQLIKEVEIEGRAIELNDAVINRLTIIPGISAYTASLITTICVPAEATSIKQWVAYLGMDVSVKESGTWHGTGKLTKRGNASLRKILFGAAWGAVMNNQQFKDYYTYLKSIGRHHYAALVIIARKLLKIMYTLVKNQSDFDPTLALYNTAPTR